MTLSSSQRTALTGVVHGPIQWDAPLAAHTTSRIGGPADALVTLFDVTELQAVLSCCMENNIAWKLLGCGSNIQATDSGFCGVIIVLGNGFKYIVRRDDQIGEKVVVNIGAGLNLHRLAYWCAAEGLGGAEFAAGISGSVGGAVVMNSGVWGRDMAQIVSAIELADRYTTMRLAADELQFSYRSCDGLAAHLENGFVVTGVECRLNRGATAVIRDNIRELNGLEKEKRVLEKPVNSLVCKAPSLEIHLL